MRCTRQVGSCPKIDQVSDKLGIHSVCYWVVVLFTIWKEMEVLTNTIQSAGLPLRQRPCTKWVFIALVTFNIISLSLFSKYNSSKLITHVVPEDIAVATYGIRNDSSLTQTKYMFIVRSDHKNLELRNVIRKAWYSNYTDAHHSWRTSNDAKLLFVIEDSQNSLEYSIQDLQFNDTLWIPNSGPRSIESVKFLEILPTSLYYTISLDTTFVNFDNVIHFLQEQGKRMYK